MPRSGLKLSRRLLRYSQIFGCLLFAFAVLSVAKPAHAAFVNRGSITLCHAASAASVSWNSVAASVSLPANTSATFQVQTGSGTSCTSFGTGSGFTTEVALASNSTTAHTLPSTLAHTKVIQIKINLVSTDGVNTPILSSVTLTDTPDTTVDNPPSAPTNLHTTANTASHVDLAWTASTDDHGVTGYKVFRDSTQIGTPTSTSFSDTTVAGSKTYAYTVTAVDTANQQSSTASLSVTTPAAVDTTPPTSTLNALPTLTGTATVSATASDNSGGSGVKKVDFYRSAAGGTTCTASSTLIGTDTTGTSGIYSVSWNTTTVTDGVYKICSIATDNASLAQTMPSTLSGTVSNPDTTKPTVSLTAPAPAPSVITGKTVTLSATATDNSGGSGVKNVQFQVDGVNVGSPDTTPSGTTYSINWDSTTVASGSRIVTAVATDNANNAQPSAGVTINVVNSTTAVTAPGAGATLSGASVSLATTTLGANGQVTSVDYMLGSTVIASTTTKTAITGGYSWTTTWNSSTTANGAYNLTAVAKDNGVSVGASPAVGITVNNVTVTISITSPANNSSVSTASPVTISATTTGSGITSVQFKDGSTTIGTDSTGPSPWSTSWDTAGLTVGSSHTLTAVAAGSSGTLATSSGVLVTIIDTTPPTAPTNVSASVVSSGQVNVTWSVASDNVGVTGYRVFRNGSTTALTTVTGTSYSDTTVAPTTSYFYTVKAIDAAGNVSAASSPSGTVTTPCAGDCMAPSVPTNVAAVATAYNKVTLTWTASSDNVAVDHYAILRGGVVMGTSATTSYSDSTVSSSTTYSYVVKAQDAAGNVSAASALATVTTPAQPDTQKPTPPASLTGSATSANQIDLSWSAATDNVGVVLYRIYRNGLALTDVTTLSYGDGTVSDGTTYSYYVTALDQATNESAASNAISVTTPSLAPPTYTYQLVSQSSSTGSFTIKQGSTATYTLVVKNTGNVTWSNTTNPVRLATWDPTDRTSAFYTSSWVSPSRPSTLKEASVAPGQNGTFVFDVKASTGPGFYSERFNLVMENVSWFVDPWLEFDINVSHSTFTWSMVSQSSSTGSFDFAAGTTASWTLIAKNTGDVTWTNGYNPVRLATWNPSYRTSAFYDPSWISQYRVVNLKESSVAPGQNGTFTFKVHIPSAGFYAERFNLIMEGVAWFDDPWMEFDINVH